jgi:hypothetical protein
LRRRHLLAAIADLTPVLTDFGLAPVDSALMTPAALTNLRRALPSTELQRDPRLKL